MSDTTVKRHSKRTCEHCDSAGYRLDFYGVDHYGSTTQRARKCEAGTAPCPEHACYWK